jgi:hypothetical protein
MSTPQEEHFIIGRPLALTLFMIGDVARRGRWSSESRVQPDIEYE